MVCRSHFAFAKPTLENDILSGGLADRLGSSTGTTDLRLFGVLLGLVGLTLFPIGRNSRELDSDLPTHLGYST